MATKCPTRTEIEQAMQKVGDKVNKTNIEHGKNSRKTHKMDVHEVKHSMIYNLFNKDGNPLQAKRQIKKIMAETNAFILYARIKAAELLPTESIITENIKHQYSDRVRTDKDRIRLDGEVMRNRGIVMQHLLKALVSTRNDAVNAGLTQTQIEALTTNGVLQLGGAGLIEAIGRDIAYTKGFKISEQAWFANKMYKEIGLAALEEMQSNTSALEVTNGQIVNRNFQENSAQPYEKNERTVEYDSVIHLDLGQMMFPGKETKNYTDADVQTVSDAAYALEHGTSLPKGKTFKPIKDTMNASNIIHRLSVPSNMMIQGEKATTRIDVKDIKKVSKGVIRELIALEGRPFVVEPTLTGMLKYFADKLYSKFDTGSFDGSSSFDQAVNTLVGKRKNADKIKRKVFGASEYYVEETKDSEKGKSLSKTEPMSQLFQNANKLLGKHLYNSYELYRTTRFGIKETSLNQQADKFFSRFVTTGGEAEITVKHPNGKMTDDYIHLVNDIADQSGISTDHVIEPIDGSMVDYLLNRYEEVFHDKNPSEKAQWDFIFDMSLMDTGLKGSVWEQLESLRGISSVRNPDTNGNIVTTYQTKPDATTSGVILQLLQIVGKFIDKDGNDKAKDLLMKLGVMGNKNDPNFGKYPDIYDVLVQKLINPMDNKADEKERQEMMIIFDSLIEMGVYPHYRELSKGPTMTFAYSQGEEGAMGVISDEMAVGVINSMIEGNGNLDVIKDLLGDKWLSDNFGDTDVTMKDLLESNNIREGLTRGLEPSAAYLRNQLQSELGVLSGDYLKHIEELYTPLREMFRDSEVQVENGERKKTIELKILPAYTAIPELNEYERDQRLGDEGFDPEADKKRIMAPEEDRKGHPVDFTEGGTEVLKLYGIPLTSRRELFDGSNLRLEELPNVKTAIVNAIHSIDFAVLLLGHKRTVEALKQEKKDIEQTNPERARQIQIALNQASVSIHDAINSNSTYNTEYQKHYRKAIVDVSLNYNINLELVKAIEALESEGLPSYPKDTIKQTRQAIEDGVVQNKKEISTMTWNNVNALFGHNNNMDEVGSYKPKLRKNNDKKFGDNKNTARPEEERNPSGLPEYSEVEHITEERKDKGVSQSEAREKIKGFQIDEFEYYSEAEADKFFHPGGNKIIGMDIESTGKDIKNAHSYEIAFSIYDNGSEIGTKVFNLPLEYAMPESTFEFNNKNSDEINNNADNVSRKKVLEELIDFLADEDPMAFTAYNSSYDFGLLFNDSLGIVSDKHQAKLDSLLNTTPIFDTMLRAQKTKKDTGTLASKYKQTFKRELKEAHSALPDIQASMKLNKAIVTRNQETFNVDENVEPEGKTTAYDIKRLAKTHPRIAKFLENFNKWDDVFELGSRFEYNSKTKKIRIPESTGRTEAEILTAIEHEIGHYETVAYVADNQKNKDVEDARAIYDKLVLAKKTILRRLGGKDTEAGKRFNYIVNNEKGHGFLEMLTILKNEPEIAEAIYKAAGGGKIMNAIKDLIQKIKNYIAGADTKRNLKAMGMKVSDIKNSIDNVAKSGILYGADRKTKGKQEIFGAGPSGSRGRKGKPNKTIEQRLAYNSKTAPDPGKDSFGNVFDTINKHASEFVFNYTGVIVEYYGEKAARATDEYLRENFPMYVDNRERVTNFWESTRWLNQMKGYIDQARYGSVKAMNQMMTIVSNAEEERNAADSDTILSFNKEMKGLEQDEIESINDLVAVVPLFNLINADKDFDTLLEHKGDITKKINEFIKKYEAKQRRSPRKINIAKQIARLLALNEVSSINDLQNVDQMNLRSKDAVDIKALVALYTMKHTMTYEKAFKAIRDRPVLINRIKDASKALQNQTRETYALTGDNKLYKENQKADMFSENYDLKAVNQHDMKINKYPANQGWKVLRYPEAGKYGIMYRDAYDASLQQGLATTITYRYTDVVVDEESRLANPTNALKINPTANTTAHKVILTTKEKDTLGIVKEPGDSLIRAYSKLREISDTQIVRYKLMHDGYVSKINNKIDYDTMVESLDNINAETRPWFIKLGAGMNLADVPEGIMKYYEEVPDHVANINGFRTAVSLVRKDASHWLVGHKDAIAFKDNPDMRRVLDVVKKLVKMTKIHWIITNVKKIAADTIANNTILISYGVPIKKIFKYSYEASKEIITIGEYRTDLVNAKMRAMAYPDNKKIQAEYKIAEKKVNDHAMAKMLKHGMFQSINTEILVKDDVIVSGLQADIEKLFNKFLRNKSDKELNGFGLAIHNLSVYGFNVDKAIRWAGENIKNFEHLEIMGRGLEEMGQRIGDTKQNEDVAKYLSEFIGSPQSEIVKFGSALTQLADIIPRFVLFEHFLEQGMEEHEAAQLVLEAFINYKINMPEFIKNGSDFGVFLFPSFWLRIQIVLWRLIKKNPVTTGVALSLSEAANLNIPSVYDAFLPIRAGDIFNVPPVAGDDLWSDFFPTSLLG